MKLIQAHYLRLGVGLFSALLSVPEGGWAAQQAAEEEESEEQSAEPPRFEERVLVE
jgi:hypothetical protein